MNTKEIAEIRRRVRADKSNMTAIHGCYINDNKQVIAKFSRSTAMMSENEADKYFALLRRSLSGTIGKNLIDISFKTSQVADSPEHTLLQNLRNTGLKDDAFLDAFYEKVMEAVDLDTSYLILVGCDSYDVPFKGKDDITHADSGDEVYKYILCAICPVKQTKATLHYKPEEKEFHDGGITNVACAPEMGFLFPAFDGRSTNIYNALYYTHSPKVSHEGFVQAIFNAPIPKPAFEQKKSFESLLVRSLEKDCSMDVVESIHDELSQCIEMHKQSRVPEPLLIDKEQVKQVLARCEVSEAHIAKFSIDYDAAFGFEAQLHPKNIIDNKHFEIKTPDVTIRVNPERKDLIQTRIIGGVRYIMICAEEDIEVNGVSIHIEEKEFQEV